MKRITSILIAAAFCVSFAAAQAKALKIATIAPARSVWDVEERRLAQEWARISGNKIQMQFLSATAMGGETGVIQKLNAVRPGQRAPIDGAIFTNLGVAALAPETKFLTLACPFVFREQEEVNYVLKELTPQLEKAVEAKGYKILGWFNVGWAYFYTKKPVHTPADLKSQRMSVAGVGMPDLTNTFKAAGFATMDVPSEKLLQSMRTPGGVEGFYSIPMYAYAGQYYKSLPYILDVPLFPVIAAFMMSEKSWNEIPAQYHDQMVNLVTEAEGRFIESQRTADQDYIKRAVDGGCTLVTLSADELKVMQDTLGHDADAMVGAGLFDRNMYDAIVAILKKYRGQ